jgi:hypothetical protein
MEETRAKPDRTLLVILAIIAALVVVAIVVVFTSGSPQLREPGTPERAVQDYAAAVIDGDRQAAEELLSSEWKDNCEPTGTGVDTAGLRITLVSTRERGDSAIVTVSVATGYDSGPFGGSGYEYEDRFQLDRDGDSWVIAQAPWEFTICPGSDRS